MEPLQASEWKLVYTHSCVHRNCILYTHNVCSVQENILLFMFLYRVKNNFIKLF